MFRKIQRLLRWIVLLFFGSTILAVFIYKWCPVYVTPLMIIRCAQQVSHGEKLRLKHHWVPLDSMSIYMPVAVMASEDQNVFLWPNSSWVRKGLEAYFTILIELVWGKERIMEVYLNSIEMGDGIYGAEAVAQQHFGRRAITLTRPNCALVAATLPNPLKYNSKEPSAYMLKRQTAIMTQMRHIDIFPRKTK